ncbi:pentatricopeptide repeat-containing protein At2g30100, chloroplastic [Nymphaea colorata]|uniref:pentatricopeptide repeat-containing protein At2g30100, chloroplastic n=1 Tax=Nymphaea colorata TaxID=210225 RepID=UPI00129E5428|nr:pentatricopeptide repeat-containing protein At2g30100, chloroplastic [Nymphaea colorata]
MALANRVAFVVFRSLKPSSSLQTPSSLPWNPAPQVGIRRNKRISSGTATISVVGRHRYPGFVFPGEDDRETCGLKAERKPSEAHVFELEEPLLSEGKEGMSDGFLETIEELERMVREPADILEEMNNKLSAREFQLVLVYFSQEGRDSWCALEVFDFLRKENQVDKETMELMVSIMCNWVTKLIEADCDVSQVVDLLKEMDCVGLNPEFSMVEKVISLYWDRGRKAKAVAFVKHVIGQGLSSFSASTGKQGPIGYLVWKMMTDGDYRGAVKLVVEFRECGLKPEIYSYLIALTALVKEQNEFSKSLRRLKKLQNDGVIADLDVENLVLVEKYQLELLNYAEQLSSWAIQENLPEFDAVVHEKLLALYACAGRGLEAEHHLWKMKLAGKEPQRELYGIVLAVCASERNVGSVQRLLTGMESRGMSPRNRKRTFSWLLRGYVKGGHFEDASRALVSMLDHGLHPEHLDIAVVLQGLRKTLQNRENIELYLDICKRLSDEELIAPCLIYLHINAYKLWIVRML